MARCAAPQCGCARRPLPRVNFTIECYGPDDVSPVSGAEGRQNVTYDILHARFNHSTTKTLRMLPDALRDAPAGWARALKAGPTTHCDPCCKGKADKMPSHAHQQEPARVGHASFDIYTVGLAHVHGGQRYVMGFHEHKSKVDKVYLLHRKSGAAECIMKYAAWCESHHVKLYCLHTDNAPEFHVPRIQQFCNERGIRLTSCAPNEPRGNGTMERRWRIFGNNTRTALAAWGGPVSWWWYFLRATTITSNLIPRADGVAPWTVFTGGAKPSGRAVRVLGTLAYYKVTNPASKVHPRARRCIYLGPAEDQLAYIVWDLELQKIVTTPHVRFAEQHYVSLSKRPAGGEPTADQIFSDEETFAETGKTGDTTILSPTPETADADEEAPESASDEHDDEEGDKDGDDAGRSPPISSRLQRVRRQATLPNINTTSESNYTFPITVPEQGGYIFYFGSGSDRAYSVRQMVEKPASAPKE